MKELSVEHPELENEIIATVESGNELEKEFRYEEALTCYRKAWSLLPESKLSWEIASWIASSSFGAYFAMGQFESAKTWGEISLQTRSSDIDTGPLIDLGMVCFELEQYDEACRYFDEAYGYGKKRAFKERPKKYLDYYLGRRNSG